MSRYLNPGDFRPSPGANEQQNHNRTYVGQIKGVNTRNGTIDVAISVSGKKEKMVIPLGGLSVQGFSSAWQRFMPTSGDFVKVAYSADNRPQCVGMAAWGNDNKDDDPDQQRFGSTAYHQGGYARIARLAKQRAVGLSEFTELRQGEWDMRSAGGAYIKGTDKGTLQLAGGLVTFNIKRERNEIESRAGLVKFDEGNTRLSLGNIKRRLLPTDFEDSEPLATPGKEYLLQIGTQPGPAPVPGIELYEEHAGDIRDPTSLHLLPTFSPVLPTRYRQRVFGAGTVDAAILPVNEVYLKEIDLGGNVAETLGLGSLQHTVGQTDTIKTPVPTCMYSNRYLSSTTSTLLTNVVASDLPAGGVFLGSASASQPVLLGTTFATAQLSLMGTLGAAHTANAAFMAAVAAWAAAYAVENAVPPVPSAAVAGAVTGLATAAITAASAATAQTVAMTTATSPDPVGYLSLKVLAE